MSDQTARIAALEAALKPFADFADPNRRFPATMPITNGSGMARRQLTMGDLYAALEALAGAVAPSNQPKASDPLQASFIAGKRVGYSEGVVHGWDTKKSFVERLIGDAFIEPEVIRQHRVATKRDAENRGNRS